MTKVMIAAVIIAAAGVMPGVGLSGVLVFLHIKPLMYIIYGTVFEFFGHSLGVKAELLLSLLNVKGKLEK